MKTHFEIKKISLIKTSDNMEIIMNKKVLTAALISVAITAQGALADSSINVKIDGNYVDFDVEPQIINDRTMVPMRAVFEALGAKVIWESDTKTALAYRNGTNIRIKVGDSYIIKDDTAIKLDSPAVIVDGRTLVPVRAISESFGYEVGWDGVTRTVNISSAADFNSTGISEEVSVYGIPPYSGQPYTVINNDVPYFSAEDMVTESFESYSELDSLGRCGAAYANLCLDTMPTEERGNIGMIKPTGWHTVKYDCVDGKYLYNRCHLIGFQLAGENANIKNLITGTRYMNVEGMLPFENDTADYIQETKNHVLYRVTPVYSGDNLVADGVLMEALSVEDGGAFGFNVFCYNVQPGVIIDYSTGESRLAG